MNVYAAAPQDFPSSPSPSPSPPPPEDAHFALARVNDSVCLVHVASHTPPGALSPLDVHIFRHEFLSIFRLSHAASVHPSDFCLLSPVAPHRAAWDPSKRTVCLARDVMDDLARLSRPTFAPQSSSFGHARHTSSSFYANATARRTSRYGLMRA